MNGVTLADVWVVVGAVSGVVAALGGIAAVTATIIYGRRTDADAQTAIRYERLREARELLGTIRLHGDNTRFETCNDTCARLKVLLPQIGGDFPATRELTAIRWELDTYLAQEFQRRVRDSMGEVDAAIASLG